MNRLKDLELLDCPFCGHTPDREDLNDVIYPTGTYWAEGEFGREYFSRHDRPENANTIYKFICQTTHGGCDAEITGDSFENTINKWNMRVSK